MIKSLIFTVGSLFFIILLLIVYFSKKRFLSIRNKTYRYLLVVDVILVVTEIISILCLLIDNQFLNLFLHRIHWSTGLIWFTLLYYYSVIFLSGIVANNIKEIINKNKTTKVMSIIFAILMLIYFFIPFNELSINNISFLPGYASYYVFSFCAFSVFSIMGYLFKNRKNIVLRNRISVWIMIVELAITFILQLSFPNISFLAIAATLQMYFLYFNIENPDLKMIRELSELKEKIEKSNKAKSDFLSNTSHEIRTPMNAIVGFSESLLNDTNFDPEKAKGDIRHIYSAGNSLLDIINNILDISKIESGNEELEEKEYFLSNIIMELSSIIDARLGDKPVKLIIDVDKEIPSKLYGDSTKLFQILLNILTNAIKYTEVGKIKLSVTKSYTKNGYVDLHFKVSDTGYGIKKEDYNKIFSKFSRLDTAKTNEIEGTGLGLVITKKYVDLMNGRITFESEYEVGTTFYVDISQKIVNKSFIGNIVEPDNEISQKELLDCSKYRVLIVDDNKLNLKVASRILSKYKFQIDTLDSGKDCVYKIKEGEEYDMIFLDHMMPEMDGIETMHILKKLKEYKVPPIVALTANAITGMKEMYLKEGFDEYLSKPINIAELNKIILKYFK